MQSVVTGSVTGSCSFHGQVNGLLVLSLLQRILLPSGHEDLFCIWEPVVRLSSFSAHAIKGLVFRPLALAITCLTLDFIRLATIFRAQLVLSKHSFAKQQT